MLFMSMTQLTINGLSMSSANSWKYLLNRDLTLKSISGDVSTAYKWFEKEFALDDLKAALIECFKRKEHPSVSTYLLKNGPHNFSPQHLDRFLEWKTRNPRNLGSQYLTMLYANPKVAEAKIELEKRKKRDKFSQMYGAEYWMKKFNISEEEAWKKVEEHKSNKSTSLSSFIKRHGKKDGERLFREWADKCVNTPDNFKKRYGNEWEKRWESYTSKDSSSTDWALKKAEGNVELAKKIFREKTKKTTVTLETLKKKHGIDKGIMLWEQISASKDNSSMDYFLRLCNGNADVASEMYSYCNSKKDSSSLKYFTKKYSHNPELALLEFNKKRSLSDCASLSYFMSKCDMDISKAKKAYDDARASRKVKQLRASKASLEIFLPLYNQLIESGVSESDIFLGWESHSEFFLREGGDLFFYDFCVKSQKKIIEFNGKAWHPNWEKYKTVEDMKLHFKNKRLLSNVQELVNKEKRKIEYAENAGFELLVLWEEDGVQVNIEKANTFLT